MRSLSRPKLEVAAATDSYQPSVIAGKQRMDFSDRCCCCLQPQPLRLKVLCPDITSSVLRVELEETVSAAAAGTAQQQHTSTQANTAAAACVMCLRTCSGPDWTAHALLLEAMAWASAMSAEAWWPIA